ncbi:MAG TPA: hypothetical protein VLS25_00310 [Dehalococcoidia bacterium]|nr:hypothetical protein [Dehalococcoidia bacterium]
MSFATEWALAVHRAVWFPLLWMTGFEGRAMEAPFLAMEAPLIDEAAAMTGTVARPTSHGAKSCLGTRDSRCPQRRPRARPAARVRHRA